MPGEGRCRGEAARGQPRRECVEPPAQPLHSAPQVIEKMEGLLKNKLQERSEPLPNRLQGKPGRGELLPRSHPGPGVPPSQSFPVPGAPPNCGRWWDAPIHRPLHSLLPGNPQDTEYEPG